MTHDESLESAEPMAEDDSPRQFREYAAELKALAQTSSNNQQRSDYLKMATVWLHNAIRWEYRVDLAALTGRDPAQFEIQEVSEPAQNTESLNVPRDPGDGDPT
jgi:hypothetical protein